jgi:hypothetical protein
MATHQHTLAGHTMYQIAFIQAGKLVEVFTPSRFNAYRTFYAFLRAGVRPRLFKVAKQQCTLIF